MDSKYQLAIYDAIQNTTDNIVVEALAGSGKSTTIERAVARITGAKCLILAFNKHIAESMRQRMPAHVDVSTCNAYGNRVVFNNTRTKLNVNKVRNILLYRVLDLDNQKKKGDCFKLVKPVCQIVSLLRAHACEDVTKTDELIEKYGIEIPESPFDFKGVLDRTFELTVARSGVIDFDDQIYLPVINGWLTKNYDIVFIDEAQDLNYVQMLFVKQIGHRVVAVGDRHQAIYGFRGADPDAIQNFTKILEAKTLPLNVCYRCSKAVIQEAQTIVPEIEAGRTDEGSVTEISENELNPQENEWVLCRTTAPLVAQCLKMIRKGIKAVVKGRDIGEQLAELIKSLGPETAPTEGFYLILESWAEKQRERLQKSNRQEELISLEDRVETIRCLLEDTQTLGDVLRRIETVFSDDRAAVMFCTVHRSKGLEADRVYIMRPDLIPHPKASLEWQKQQEENLHYVAITRAKQHLVYVWREEDMKAKPEAKPEAQKPEAQKPETVEILKEIEKSDAGIRFEAGGATLPPEVQEVLKKHGYI